MAAIFTDTSVTSTPQTEQLIARAPVNEPFLLLVPGDGSVAALPTPIPATANAAVVTIRGPSGETSPDPSHGIWYTNSSPPLPPAVDSQTGQVLGERGYRGIPGEYTSRAELEAFRAISASTQDAWLLVQYYTAPRAVAVVHTLGDSGMDEIIRSTGATPPPDPNEPAIRQNTATNQWEGWNVDQQIWEAIAPPGGVQTTQVTDLFGNPAFLAVSPASP